MRLRLLLFSSTLFTGWACADGRWDYSAESNGLQFRTELNHYDQDFSTTKKGLDFFRSDVAWAVSDRSAFEVEFLADSRENKLDVNNLNTLVKNRTHLFQVQQFTVSLLGSVTVPVSDDARRAQGVRPTIGVPVDFYRSPRFSTGAQALMEDTHRRYLLSWYMNLRLSQALTTYVDVFAQKAKGANHFQYSTFSTSLVYDLTRDVKLNVKTSVGADPTAFVLNSVLGTSLLF